MPLFDVTVSRMVVQTAVFRVEAPSGGAAQRRVYLQLNDGRDNPPAPHVGWSDGEIEGEIDIDLVEHAPEGDPR